MNKEVKALINAIIDWVMGHLNEIIDAIKGLVNSGDEEQA